MPESLEKKTPPWEEKQAATSRRSSKLTEAGTAMGEVGGPHEEHVHSPFFQLREDLQEPLDRPLPFGAAFLRVEDDPVSGFCDESPP